jgi:MFS transporter, YNFM family, putative membrane transport protein
VKAELTPRPGEGMAGFLLGAAGMFATMYSTQAILPELSREFEIGPSRAGLSVSSAVFALALGAWLWGPLSDRIGRPRAIRLASWLLVAPTLGVALAPTFPLLLLCRGLQGLCMPGLLVVGAPYVVEVLVPRVGQRVMGWYVGALVFGGLVGRVGVALATGVVGWRVASAMLAALPLAAALAMRGGLEETGAPERSDQPLRRIVSLRLFAVAAIGSTLFFAFVGTFTYVVYRLEDPPFNLSLSTASLVFLLWIAGATGPLAGRLAERYGWRRLAAGAVALSTIGVLLTLPSYLPTLVIGLGFVATATFTGYTAAQLGVGDVARTDRGAASAFYFSAYYGSGALGAYLPGLAWEAAGWGGVAACGLSSLALAMVGLVVLARETGRHSSRSLRSSA